MCVDPVTLGAGAAVVGTGLSIVDRISSAGAAGANRSAAIKTVLTETVPEINKSLASVYNSNHARVVQESDAAATLSLDILRGMAEAKSTAKATAGDIGVGSVSFANILPDFEMREGLAKGAIDSTAPPPTRSTGDVGGVSVDNDHGPVRHASLHQRTLACA